jgi:hypothetical protein
MKAEQVDLDATNAMVATKASQADLNMTNAALAQKADQSVLDVESARLDQTASQVASNANNIQALQSTVGDLDARVTANAPRQTRPPRARSTPRTWPWPHSPLRSLANRTR